jgi:hypothetical protein
VRSAGYARAAISSAIVIEQRGDFPGRLRPVADEPASPSDLPPVWPDPQGRQRGIAVSPLHPAVPELARRDPELAERLALIDAIRMGDARVRRLAIKLLGQRLARPVAHA